MPIIIDEAFKSRNRVDGYSQESDEYVYIMQGSDDDNALQSQLNATAPTFLRDLFLLTTSIEQVSEGLWLGRARYGPPTVLDVGQTRFSFNTAGGTQHVAQSANTVSARGTSGTIDTNTFGHFINVSANDVQGVDITVPVFEWEETHVLANSTVTPTYIGLIYSLTGKACNSTFKGGNEGEILFLGGGGGQRPDTKWEVTFKFAGSGNVTGLTLGGISGVNKKGWEYLWSFYTAQATTIGPDNVTIQKPKYAMVEQVYSEADLLQLGIGTTLPNS